MMILKKHIIFIIFLLIGLHSYSQIRINDLHYRNDNSGLSFSPKQNIHSSVKPYILNNSYIKSSSKLSLGSVSTCDGVAPMGKPKARYKIYPLTNFSSGFDNMSNITYTAGLGLGVDYGKRNFIFQ